MLFLDDLYVALQSSVTGVVMNPVHIESATWAVTSDEFGCPEGDDIRAVVSLVCEVMYGVGL